MFAKFVYILYVYNKNVVAINFFNFPFMVISIKSPVK